MIDDFNKDIAAFCEELKRAERAYHSTYLAQQQISSILQLNLFAKQFDDKDKYRSERDKIINLHSENGPAMLYLKKAIVITCYTHWENLKEKYTPELEAAVFYNFLYFFRCSIAHSNPKIVSSKYPKNTDVFNYILNRYPDISEKDGEILLCNDFMSKFLGLNIDELVKYQRSFSSLK